MEGYKQLLHNWNENEWVLEDSRGLSVASVPTTRSDKWPCTNIVPEEPQCRIAPETYTLDAVLLTREGGANCCYPAIIARIFNSTRDGKSTSVRLYDWRANAHSLGRK